MQKAANQTSRAMKADIGIVVIGRNEGFRLVRCLKSLRLDPVKIVYVDSGSTDGSDEDRARVDEAKQAFRNSQGMRDRTSRAAHPED
jgi:hypothetical protein